MAGVSDNYYDYFYFELDENYVRYIYQDLGWQQVIYDVPPGEHTLRWRFSRGTSKSAGLNAALLDQIVVASLLPEPAILGATSLAVEAGEPFTYQIVTTKSPQSFGASPLPAGHH